MISRTRPLNGVKVHCVYAIQSGGHTGPIKIGITDDLYNRRSSLQNGNPEQLTILFYAEVKNREEATRRRAEKALTDARDAATRLKKLTVTIYAKTGDSGRLFGSVTNADIAIQLKREAGLDIDKRKIEVEPPIKSLGPHEVTVQLHTEVSETLRVVVAAQ